MPHPAVFHKHLVLAVPLPIFWPVFTETDRIQRDVGAPRTTLTLAQHPDGEPFVQATTLDGPLPMTWEERPDEWIREHSMRHEHRFLTGPLASSLLEFQLSAPSAGQTVV